MKSNSPTPKAGAGGTRRVSMAQVLERARRLVTQDRMDDAVKLLKEAAANFKDKEGKTYTLAELIYQTAMHVRLHSPAVAGALAREALKHDEALVGPWVTLATLADRTGEMKAAKEACLKVVNSPEAKPEQILTVANLLVRYKEETTAHAAAVKAFDALDRPLDWASALLYIGLRVADWPLCKQLTDQLRVGHLAGRTKEARESPRTNLLWCDDEDINIAVVEEWSRSTMAVDDKPPPQPEPLAGRKIRVGYLSSDFRDHPTSRLMNGAFRHHDREKFELFLYDSGWDDGSQMRKEVDSHFDHLHSVTNLSDEDAAQLIRSHKIDVLVELNGPTRATRMGILRHRPAPVQIDYLGWPGSVGGRVVDYVVGDEYTVPAGMEAKYAEKVIRIHKTYQINDYAAREIGPAPTREQYKLPEGVPVLGMFNAINKVRGDVWHAWMQIMKAVPDAVLWILDPGPVARKNMGRACQAAGVSPKRVIAAPAAKQDDHLARLQLIDLMLDPWPYGGHTSTSDALFAGVPVIALEGKNFAGRVSGGLLKAARLDELVRPTLESYAKTAVGLLRTPGKLAEIKEIIRTRVPKTDVFNAKSKTRQFEAAYIAALHRVVAGKPPEHMTFFVSGEGGAKKMSMKWGPLGQPAGATVSQLPVKQPAAANDPGRRPLVLVCGPWSSGTSAVAGMLAKAGLAAPGPYVSVNDAKTPATYEMKAFQKLMQKCASEQTLKRTLPATAVLEELKRFRDTTLAAAAPGPGMVMLKHGLAALMLPELTQLFDVRVIGVLRPFEAIEATRVRRRWQESFGSKGAAVIYRHLFNHVVNADTPFKMLRYTDVLARPEAVLDELAAFCGMTLDDKRKAEALAFVARPADTPSRAAA